MSYSGEAYGGYDLIGFKCHEMFVAGIPVVWLAMTFRYSPSPSCDNHLLCPK